MYEDLRDVPRWNNVSLCLSQRIRSGLELVELEEVRMRCPDLLLWVLMLGRSGANPLERSETQWFLDEIGEVESSYEIQVPPGIKDIAGLRYFEIAEGTMMRWRANSSDIDTPDSDVFVKDDTDWVKSSPHGSAAS